VLHVGLEVAVSEQQHSLGHDPGIAACRASKARRGDSVFLALIATLERQGLRPNAVLIEHAVNGPAVCQLLSR
jgi:hypothetical protein